MLAPATATPDLRPPAGETFAEQVALLRAEYGARRGNEGAIAGLIGRLFAALLELIVALLARSAAGTLPEPPCHQDTPVQPAAPRDATPRAARATPATADATRRVPTPRAPLLRRRPTLAPHKARAAIRRWARARARRALVVPAAILGTARSS